MNYDHKKLCSDISEIDWNPVYDSTDVNLAVSYFNSELRKSFDKHAPLIEKRVKGRECKWLNAEIKNEMNTRDQFHRKAQKSGKDSDWFAYKKQRNKCNNLTKKAKANYHCKLIDENISNPRKFWNCIKAIFPSKPRQVRTFSRDEQKSVVESFSKYFSGVVKILKSALSPLVNPSWRFVNSFMKRTNKRFNFNYVSRVFILKELRSLKRQKATGVDELPPGMLKDCSFFIAGPLAHIINLSIKTSTVPSIWKIAKITPVFKSGDSSQPENYRPISVLPVLSKILEKAVHSNLISFLEDENLLNDCQYGFRSKRSTKLASTLFCDEIRREIDAGKMVGAVYIDLSKAFDTIGHAILFKKLEMYGVNRQELDWFVDYLFGRSQLVEINNTRSDKEPIYCGVPQGSILGPLLFIVFYNDFAESLAHSRLIMYTDDTVVYVAEKDVKNIEMKLNEDLERISKYFCMNELIINLKKGKTEVMLFGTSKRLKTHGKEIEVTYDNVRVNFVTQYKYLGTIVDNHLNFNENFHRSYKRASTRMRLLQRLRC